MTASIPIGSKAGMANIFCLIVAMLLVLAFPGKKEIWYDETVSIRCSKGISHDTPMLLSGTDSTNSTSLEKLNTPANVFNATLLDNGNSFLYNICLHWFTLWFGNSVTACMFLSKLCAIAALIAFYLLCNLFFNGGIFTSLALLFLATDTGFIGMSHEIRAYSMATFFVVIAAVYFFKFLFREERPLYLFLTGMFSAGAILSHFLTVYIIVVFLAVLLIAKGRSLFTGRNMLAILLPVLVLVAYFYFSYTGLQTMNSQNQKILARSGEFSIWEAALRSMKFTAINFKIVFPAFGNHTLVTIASFVALVALYITAAGIAPGKPERNNLHLLFALGAMGSLFLLFLSAKSGHYTALYYRYYLFCAPFCCLFVAYLLFIFVQDPQMNAFIKDGLLAVVALPVALLFILGMLSEKPRVLYNHAAVAKEIVQDKVTKMEMPEWEDALLVQCFLPRGYKIDYVRNPVAPYFTLYKTDSTERIPVIKKGA